MVQGCQFSHWRQSRCSFLSEVHLVFGPRSWFLFSPRWSAFFLILGPSGPQSLVSLILIGVGRGPRFHPPFGRRSGGLTRRDQTQLLTQSLISSVFWLGLGGILIGVGSPTQHEQRNNNNKHKTRQENHTKTQVFGKLNGRCALKKPESPLHAHLC